MSRWGHLGIMLCLMLSTDVWAAIGKVSLLKGDAVASRDQQTIQLFNNSAIEEHDRIVTGNNSQIQLTFEDKTVITLGSSSMMDVQAYLNDAQQSKVKFKFTQGTFKSITGEIGKRAPENFNLETKTATIGIRGTTVAGMVGDDGSNKIILLPDPNGGVGQIVISNTGGVPTPPLDTIGCLSGAIAVNNGLGSVFVSAGFFTTVGSSQPPAPPVPLSPAQIQMLSQSAPTTSQQHPSVPEAQERTPSLVNEASRTVIAQSAQNAITQSANNAIENYERFTPSQGIAQLYYSETLQGQVSDFTIHPSATSGIPSFDVDVNLYTFDTDTNTYGSIPTPLHATIPAYTSNSVVPITNTNFKKSTALQNDLSISLLPNSLVSYDATLYYDNLYHEILIAKINADTGANGTYNQTMLIGKQSTVLSTSTPVLYYLDYGNLFISDEFTSLTQSANDPTVLAINTSNRKAFGVYIDTNGKLQLNMGHVDAHNNLTLQTYSLSYALDNALTLATFSYQNSDGALYGSANQALAIAGLNTTYMSSNDSTTYAPSINIALLSTNASPAYQNVYTANQILNGTIVDSVYGSTGTLSDLSIQLHKNDGTLSVSSSPLTIASTNSAFISDDFFAAITTGTYNNMPMLTSYLIAIPSTVNDYVSWGYWGKNSTSAEGISATTSPFSTWVAGVQTDASYISALVGSAQTFTYNGNVIGSVYENGSFNYIKSTDNTAVFVFDFQHASYTANLAFKTSNTAWTSNATLALNGNAFNSTSVNTNVTNTTPDNLTLATSSATASNTIQGNFYGPTANAVAGGFTLGNGTTYQASGSFKATK